jgi:hypothetical protein
MRGFHNSAFDPQTVVLLEAAFDEASAGTWPSLWPSLDDLHDQSINWRKGGTTLRHYR